MARYPNETTILLTGRKTNETDKAIRINVLNINGADVEPKKVWFPLSQITSIDSRSENTILRIKEWVVNKMEWVYIEETKDPEYEDEEEIEDSYDVLNRNEGDIPF